MVVLSIYGVNFTSIIVPFSTIIISLGFALGPPIQRLIDSLLFLLVEQPYENGDSVMVDRINSGGSMTVLQVCYLPCETHVASISCPADQRVDHRVCGRDGSTHYRA
jgi:small-conductance mechanosensitive channel